MSSTHQEATDWNLQFEKEFLFFLKQKPRAGFWPFWWRDYSRNKQSLLSTFWIIRNFIVSLGLEMARFGRASHVVVQLPGPTSARFSLHDLRRSPLAKPRNVTCLVVFGGYQASLVILDCQRCWVVWKGPKIMMPCRRVSNEVSTEATVRDLKAHQRRFVAHRRKNSREKFFL